MPFEILADFRDREDFTKLDRVWSGIARSISMKLVEDEPRSRFRIRNFPPLATLEESDKGASIKSGVALGEEDVPLALRSRINIPEGEEYWIHNYRCMTCLNPQTGEPGLWVPHIRRKLHHDHDLKDEKITGKGIRQPWFITHRLVIGSDTRIAGMGDLLYSVALTGPVDNVESLRGFDVIIVLPVKKLFIPEQDTKLAAWKKAGKIEHYRILPPDPIGAAKALIEDLKFIDKRFIEPEIPENPEEDPEYKQQLARSRLAEQVWAGMTGDRSSIKAAIKEEEKP